jgi:hypothetical protein
VLTFNCVALHGIAQLRDITLHSCGARLFDYFPPATDVDGNVSFFSFYRGLTYNLLVLQGVPQKQKLQLDSVRKLADHARNYHEYRSRLRETVPPAVPFLGACSDGDGPNIFTLILSRSGLYLTDITFCREGNPSHRASPLASEKKLINYSKYYKMARIVQGNGIALLEKR